MKLLITFMFFASYAAHGQISDYECFNNVRTSSYFKYRLDSIECYIFDKNTNSWNKRGSDILTYDEHRQLSRFSKNDLVQSFNHDARGNVINIENHYRDTSNKWWTKEKQIYEYNEQDQMIRTIRYSKFGKDTSVWDISCQKEFTYDDKGNKETEHFFEAWISSLNMWAYQEKTINNYNAYNDLIQQTSLKLNNNVWDTKDTRIYEYFYDNQANITKKYFFHGRLDRIKDYTYDENNNQIQEIDWYPHDQKYVWYTISYSYDLTHNINDVIMPPMAYFNDDEYNFSIQKSEYAYFYLNGLNNMITEIYKKEYNNSRIESKYIFHYSTHEITAIEDKNAPLATTVYPNPATDYISFNMGNQRPAVFDLFNVQGKKVISCILNASQKADLTGVKPGLYFYHLDNGIQTVKGKLIKE